MSGTANNDTISGIVGQTGATLSVGDNILGGSGSDTLNLIAVTSTAAPLVSIQGVETINVRILGTAAEAQVMNANDWSGVSVLTNASSLTSTTLQVSGLETTTNVKVFGDSDVNVAFRNSTTASSVSTTLVSVGTGNTATTIGSASAAATANIDLDLNNSGLLAGVAIEVQGTVNLARIEAGSNVTTYTVSGTGNAALVTDDTITSFDASAAAGNIDITFEGASDVAAKGGAGNDTFRFGTTISDGDSINGGSGTDTVAATIAQFTLSVTTTNVEAATLAFNVDGAGGFNASASTVATYNLVAGVASADASISSIVNGATVNVASDGLDDVTIDAASGASTMTLNLGSSTGQVGFEEITISDAATVTINANAGSGVSGGTAAASASGITLDADVTTVTINTSAGETDLVITDFSANALSSLTINSQGSGSITLTSALSTNTGLATIAINADGSDAADVTVGSFVDGAATADKLTRVSLVGRSGADITIGSLDLGNGATAAATATISMDAGSSSVVGTDAFDVSTTGDFDLNLTIIAGQSSTIQLGDLTFAAGTAASGASLNIAAFTANTGSFVGIEQATLSQSGAQVTVGALVAAQDATIELFGSGGMVATNVADIDIGNINVTLGASANLLIGTGTGGSAIDTTAGAIGSVTLTIADDATAEIGLIDASSIAGITLSIAGDGAAMFGGISAGTLGAINIGVAASASATFAAIQATTISSIKVSGAGLVNIGAVSATTIEGSIDARELASGTFSIDLNLVVGDVQIFLGNSTNTVVSGKGNDVINLLVGRTAFAGNDTIRYSAATQGLDLISGFIGGAAASGGDVISIEVGTGGLALFNGNSVAVASAAAVSLVSQSAGTGFSMSSANNVILLTTAYASTATMIADLASGSGKATLSSGTFVSGGKLLVAWSDATSSYISVATNMSSGGTTMASGSLTVTDATLAQISGVTPGALVAANFAFI